MGWRRTTKPTPVPSVRDRVRSSATQRPTYSYYTTTSRASENPDDGRHQKTPKKSGVGSGVAAPRGWSQIVTTGLFILVLSVCAVKIVYLAPQSKIVVVDNSTGLQSATEQYARSVDRLLAGSFLNRIKLTLNANGISRELLRSYPDLSNVVVTSPLIGNRPVIYVSVSRPAFIVETPSGRFTISENGYILARVEEGTPKLIRLVESSGRHPTLGAQFLSASTVRFASTVVYELGRANHEVSWLDLPVGAPYEIDATLMAPPLRVRFNLQGDVMEQSGAAIATLSQLGVNMQVQYLDVRVPGRVYYL